MKDIKKPKPETKPKIINSRPLLHFVNYWQKPAVWHDSEKKL